MLKVFRSLTPNRGHRNSGRTTSNPSAERDKDYHVPQIREHVSGIPEIKHIGNRSVLGNLVERVRNPT